MTNKSNVYILKPIPFPRQLIKNQNNVQYHRKSHQLNQFRLISLKLMPQFLKSHNSNYMIGIETSKQNPFQKQYTTLKQT